MQRLLCLASNLAKVVRVELERPRQIEIALNGQVLVTQKNLPQLTNTLLVPITLQSSNSLKITLKGSPLSFITVSVRGIDHIQPEILLVSPQEGQIIPSLTVEAEGSSNERLASVTAGLQGEATFPMSLSSDGRSFEGEVTSASPGPKTLIIVARDLAGNESVLQRAIRLTSTASVTVNVTAPVLPPYPVQIAPPLSQDTPQPFHETIEFLYSGPNPIQKDVQASAIREDLVATISGQVLDQDGNPLAGAKVTSLGKTELGYTISREDGKFDIAFNSGDYTTLKFERNGYASASRGGSPLKL